MSHALDNTQLRILNVVGDILAACELNQRIILTVQNDGGAGDAPEQRSTIAAGD